MENGAAALENSLAVPQMIKHRVAICPVIPLLGVRAGEMKTHVHAKPRTRTSAAASFITDKRWTRPQWPRNDDRGDETGCALQWNVTSKRGRHEAPHGTSRESVNAEAWTRGQKVGERLLRARGGRRTGVGRGAAKG